MEPLEPVKDHEEEILRAVLQAHVPPIVDTEPRWERVASQLFQHQSGAMQRSIPMEITLIEKAKVRPRFTMRRRAELVAAALFLPILLLGANFGGNRNFWGGSFGDSGIALVGTLHLYTDINQKQLSNDITITVTKAYSDAGRTLIAYEVKPSHDLAQRYRDIVLASYDLFYQVDGDVSDSNSQCMPFPHNGTAQSCLLTLTPQKSATNPKTVSLTWRVHKIYLNFNVKSGNDTMKNAYDTTEGTWDFTFTLPYSANNLGSGGPFLQH